MKTKWIKSIVIACIIIIISLPTQAAQVTLNCESGNRAIEQGNCWSFAGIAYSNVEFRISGNWSLRSNQLTSLSNEASWAKTPWIKPESGNITLKTRLENDGGTTRTIIFSYISYDANQNNVIKEGATTVFYTYNFPKPFDIWVKNLSIPMPAEIVNSNQAYKILITCIGSGGTSRIFSDDIVIPGEYWSDPSNHCLPLAIIVDKDKDGVQDADDAYPEDATRAYNNYYPSDKTFGTLAFEDNWPAKGDYDLNDVVVDYKMNRITNAENNVVEVVANFIVRASGAGYKNAFGFQLDGIAPDIIDGVKGNKVDGSSSLFKYKNNGLEENQEFANCIVFDDFFTIMRPPGGGSIGVNVEKTATFVPYVEMTVIMPLAKKISIKELTTNKFNFYIVSNTAKGDRGREIHLADAIPTSLVNKELFGSYDDNSTGAHYYRTKNNLPWGINIVQGFDYPIEKVSIEKGYNYFINWAESNGEKYQDWFQDIKGYRNSEYIYSR